MRQWHSHSEDDTRRLGRQLAAELAPAGVLLLSGDLGCGKTVLARGIGEGLGVPAAEVQSPTYTLIREHQGTAGRLIHVDLYRLDPEEVEGLGLDEVLAQPAVKVVEWAERLPYPMPGALWLRLRRGGEGERYIEQVGSE